MNSFLAGVADASTRQCRKHSSIAGKPDEPMWSRFRRVQRILVDRWFSKSALLIVAGVFTLVPLISAGALVPAGSDDGLWRQTS